MASTEAQKAKNRQYVAASRQRAREKREAEKAKIEKEKILREISRGLVSPEELLRAGQLAGQLEVAFRHNLPLGGKERALAWLGTHPVGANYVLELLSIAGLGSAFRRWRGDF